MDSQCDCSPSGKGKDGKQDNDTVRLYIPIPGVTDQCGYVCDINGDNKGDVVDYIVTVYKFLVGIAAIVAMFMIMLGGYQWIFAMGNSGKVESAKETIFSAVIGLALAIVSVQLLSTINPALVNISLPDVTKIARVSVDTSIYCTGDDIVAPFDMVDVDAEGNSIGFSHVNQLAVQTVNSLNLSTMYKCGDKFAVIARTIDSKKTCYAGTEERCRAFGVSISDTDSVVGPGSKQMPTCFATACRDTATPHTACLPIADDPQEKPICTDPQNLCRKQNLQQCESINPVLDILNYPKDKSGGRFAKRVLFSRVLGDDFIPDDYVFGPVLSCDVDSTPVYDKKSNENLGLWAPGAENECWLINPKNNNKEPILRDCTSDFGVGKGIDAHPVLSSDVDAVKGANALCCKLNNPKEGEKPYRCETGHTDSTTQSPSASEDNPLIKLSATYNDVQPAFADAATMLSEVTPKIFVNNPNYAKSFLEGLAMAESGGDTTQVTSSACGLMQLQEKTASKYNQGVTDDVIDCNWLVNNPAGSIKIAANYVKALITSSNFSLICPSTAQIKKQDGTTELRQCDYKLNDGNEKYSPCLDIMTTDNSVNFRASILDNQMLYIYAAYNGTGSANCHNESAFFTSSCKPPSVPSIPSAKICESYNAKKGSIWECDSGSGYSQTRNGGYRVFDCKYQFDQGDLNSQNPAKFDSSSCCGRGSCVEQKTSCPVT